MFSQDKTTEELEVRIQETKQEIADLRVSSRTVDYRLMLPRSIELDDRLARLQQQLAFAKGNEAPFPITWPVSLYKGYHEPLLIAAEIRCYLIYRGGTGQYISVAFSHYEGAKFARVNDEVSRCHPLYESGIRFYNAYHIHHSRWIAELSAAHSCHPQYDPEKWAKMIHFLFYFPEGVAEVVAPAYQAPRFYGSANAALCDTI